ncbi:outer membrane beta-barrel protein [Legionella feeleii]|uniref:Outer membrane protein beta-barrel domain-containing protein n=1 Tax=Legionella feeleii TaxID=453 RepID=A0A0W0TH34_9GAMM|nr:outer membrane beta-barrel protein [Legionella feeleii]KTC94878.1 hypothetical protein Lfee_2542 [Legionella feeleii]SPX62038.1 Uncharacterised protein [Legionella feeleii]
MKRTLLCLLASCLAGTTFSAAHPLYAEAGFGMASWSAGAAKESQSPTGRLSIGLAVSDSPLAVGIEAGIQSGATLRLAIPKESIEALGGVLIEGQLRPLLDALVSLKAPLGDTPFFAMVKGGVAYRQMNTDHDSVNNLNAVSLEGQAGLGYRFTQQVSASLAYQQIAGKKTTVRVNELTETGRLENIPAQQALLLSFSLRFS